MNNQYFNFPGSAEYTGFFKHHVWIVLTLGYKISCPLADVCHCFEIHWNSNIQCPSERGRVISVLIIVKWPFMLQEADFMWIVILMFICAQWTLSAVYQFAYTVSSMAAKFTVVSPAYLREACLFSFSVK